MQLWNISLRVKSEAYPEYVVDKESAKQDAARTDSVQLQELDTIQCECQSKQVVSNPVLQRQDQHNKQTSSLSSPMSLVTESCFHYLNSGYTWNKIILK